MKMFSDPAPFELIVLDWDRASFGIVGPMRNDTATERRVQKQRAAGRNLTVEGPLNKALTRAEVIDQVAARTRFTYIADIFRRRLNS